MKLLLIIGVALSVGIIMSSAAVVAETATAEKGKALFNDPKLGTNGKTCNSCHAAGKGLERSGDRKDLADVVNGCIAGPLQGKPIDPASNEMRSLILYIKTFGSKSSGGRPAIGC